MKPILQLYALCIEHLPGYDKDEEYWQKVDNELQTKPMYQDVIRRKNRLDNLKLLAVKELLFDKYINILTEPKEPKIRKATKATKSRSTKAVSGENKEITEERADITTDSNEIIKIEKQKLKNKIKILKLEH